MTAVVLDKRSTIDQKGRAGLVPEKTVGQLSAADQVRLAVGGAFGLVDRWFKGAADLRHFLVPVIGQFIFAYRQAAVVVFHLFANASGGAYESAVLFRECTFSLAKCLSASSDSHTESNLGSWLLALGCRTLGVEREREEEVSDFVNNRSRRMASNQAYLLTVR